MLPAVLIALGIATGVAILSDNKSKNESTDNIKQPVSEQHVLEELKESGRRPKTVGEIGKTYNVGKRNIIVSSRFNVGKIVPLNFIKDNLVSIGKTGRGVAVENPFGKLYAPFNGEVIYISDTKECIGIRSDDGINLVFWVGIGTEKLNGNYFYCSRKLHEIVKEDQLLLEFDEKAIRKSGYDTTTAITVFNSNDFGEIKFKLGNWSMVV